MSSYSCILIWYRCWGCISCSGISAWLKIQWSSSFWNHQMAHAKRIQDVLLIRQNFLPSILEELDFWKRKFRQKWFFVSAKFVSSQVQVHFNSGSFVLFILEVALILRALRTPRTWSPCHFCWSPSTIPWRSASPRYHYWYLQSWLSVSNHCSTPWFKTCITIIVRRGLTLFCLFLSTTTNCSTPWLLPWYCNTGITIIVRRGLPAFPPLSLAIFVPPPPNFFPPFPLLCL